MRFKKRIRPDWDNILLVQEKLGKKLKNYDKSYIDSVKMVTGELLENSVKYYMKKGIKKPIEFYFNNSDDLEISVLNQLIDSEDAETIIDLIDRINKSPNPYDLFIDRLQEILDNRIKGESKLGLLRVVSDGGFSINYKINNSKISINTYKSKKGECEKMDGLDYGDLKIEVTELDSHVKIAWIGKCRTLNPENILDSYLEKLASAVRGKKVVVTFDMLDSMNSSTVPPLLTFIKTLEEFSIDTLFLYDDSEDWQRASFKPLSVIAGKYKNVKIKAISTQNITID